MGMGLKISIVMTYWNRKQQLSNTLKSIRKYGYDVEIVIVDDMSTDGDDISCFADENTKVIRLENKTWINPCIPFNTGFKEATGDIIIIQNAECLHNGDIVAHAIENVSKGVYVTYAALAVNGSVVTKITEGEDVNAVVAPYLHNTIYVDKWDGNGWYNHSKYRAEAYHFCAAITREDLYDIGGFDERYFDGLGFDDNDLLCRIKKKGMIVKIIDSPFVIHQYHKSFQPGDVTSLMAINAIKFEGTKRDTSYDVKPFNKIFR